MGFVTCKFQPDGGQEFEVRNILHYSFAVHRAPGSNGHLGKKGHDLDCISITRHKSLQDKEHSKLDNDTVKLAAATEKKAYFKGTITLARSDDSNDIAQTLRWDKGHICALSCVVQGEEVQEVLSVCVTDLKVDDYEFKRVQTV